MADPTLWGKPRGVASKPDAPGADTRPAPGWWETAGAAVDADRADQHGTSDQVRVRAYLDVMEAMGELGFERGRYRKIMPSWQAPEDGLENSLDLTRLWRDINALPPDKRKRLGIEPTREAFEKRVLHEFGAQVTARKAVADRGSTSARIAGGIAAAATDPLNLLTGMVGGVGRAFGTRVLTEGLTAMGLEGAQQPLINQERRAQGRDELTGGEMAVNVVAAGALAGGLRAAGEGVEKFIAPKVAEAVAPVGRMLEERKLVRDFERAVPPELRTPEQAAALQVVDRGARTDEASPFFGTYAGYGWNEARIARAEADLIHGAPVAPRRAAPPAPARPYRPLDVDKATDLILELEGGAKLVTDSGGLTKWGISAKGNPGVDIPAVTRGQAASIFRTKYLAPLDLTGKSHEVATIAFDASVNHGPAFAKRLLRLAGDDPAKMIALRRGKYAQLIRENPAKYGRYAKGWENRMRRLEAELGLRPGGAAEDMGTAAGRVADDGAEDIDIAMRAERADAEIAAARDAADAEIEALLREPIEDTPEGWLAQIEAGAPVPVLRPDLFDGDTNSWRVAQAALEAEELGLPEPLVTRASIWEDARDRLIEAKGGEEKGALFHDDVGAIDVVWGNEKGGLAHIVAKHGEMIDDLADRIATMRVYEQTERRGRQKVRLRGEGGEAVISLDRDGEPQRWLLTAFDPKVSPAGKRAARMPDGDGPASVRSGENTLPTADYRRAAGDARDGSPTRGDGADIGDGEAEGKAAGDPRPADIGTRADVRRRVEQQAEALRAWDDADGPAARQQAESVAHDLEAMIAKGAAVTVRMDAEGESGVDLAELMEDIADDLDIVAKLRSCL